MKVTPLKTGDRKVFLFAWNPTFAEMTKVGEATILPMEVAEIALQEN
ncbi:hypothetical protein [Desulforhabdus sp. TSK]|nr:hypothetical protein [Desulforhabdus sp. TSK]